MPKQKLTDDLATKGENSRRWKLIKIAGMKAIQRACLSHAYWLYDKIVKKRRGRQGFSKIFISSIKITKSSQNARIITH
jgi:hypothetical protein